MNLISQFKYNNKAVNNHVLIYGKNDKVGSYILFQSYNTIVACYQLDYSKLVICNHKYSVTTSKQLNRFISTLSGAKKETSLDKEGFKRFLKNWIE